MAASAGTVLSEERVRGSLDVLLATPMSTRSILWGKWWGAFRRVPWLAFWPSLIAFSMLRSNSKGRRVTLAYLIPVMIVAQGGGTASASGWPGAWFRQARPRHRLDGLGPGGLGRRLADRRLPALHPVG